MKRVCNSPSSERFIKQFPWRGNDTDAASFIFHRSWAEEDDGSLRMYTLSWWRCIYVFAVLLCIAGDVCFSVQLIFSGHRQLDLSHLSRICIHLDHFQQYSGRRTAPGILCCPDYSPVLRILAETEERDPRGPRDQKLRLRIRPGGLRSTRPPDAARPAPPAAASLLTARLPARAPSS